MTTGFNNEDRNILIQTHTMVKSHEKRLDAGDLEDDVLHKRINELHGRINSIRNAFTAVAVIVNGAWAGFVAYMKGN